MTIFFDTFPNFFEWDLINLQGTRKNNWRDFLPVEKKNQASFLVRTMTAEELKPGIHWRAL